MRIEFILYRLFWTSLLLIVSNIFFTTLFPFVFNIGFRPSLNVVILLFLAYRLQGNSLPFIILFFQSVHGAFTAQGWAFATLAGIGVGLIISRIKDMVHFYLSWVQVAFTFVFSWIYFFILSFFMYLKTEELSFFYLNLGTELAESLFSAALAPFIFKVMKKIWKTDSATEAMVSNV